MKKTLLILTLFLGFNLYSQQFEIGPTVGYWFDNIADYDSESERSVIGKALWNPNFGISAIYYFKKPNEIMTGRIGLLYRNSKKGSVSEINENNKFEFNTNSFGLIGGIARDVGKKYILYFDIGFSYNIIDNSEIYDGDNSQLISFPKLNNTLEIEKNEFAFLYGIGV